MVKAVLFDLGDTLIHEKVDDAEPLDVMTLELQPYAADALRQLAEKYALAIVSDTESSPETSVRKALNRLGIEKFFQTVVTSIDVGTRKPDPTIFLEALERLGVNPPLAVLVGNDPDSDIAAGRAIGLRTVLYRSSRYHRPEADADADYVVDSLAELPGLIERLDT
ncbi:HAD family hydrolase [Streptomyces sp. NPDC052107]|uniref:HAD family hydrolase n=1 Tax=Streptomyces sp. NPDC052107 TaxID=3155632 RepID=UPI003420F3EE